MLNWHTTLKDRFIAEDGAERGFMTKTLCFVTQTFSIHCQTSADCNNRFPFLPKLFLKYHWHLHIWECTCSSVHELSTVFELVKLPGLLLSRFVLNYIYQGPLSFGVFILNMKICQKPWWVFHVSTTWRSTSCALSDTWCFSTQWENNSGFYLW